MATEWIHQHIGDTGTWTSGMSAVKETFTQVSFTTPARVRILETAVSGMVLLSGATAHCYGGPEVFLKISYAGRPYRYLSAPVSAPLDLAEVTKIELGTLYVRSVPGSASTTYRAYVNAHCIYETL